MIALVNPAAITLSGLVTGAVYGVAAMGLVVNYKVSRVVNLAFGAIAMFCAYCFWQLQVQWGLPKPVAIIVAVAIVPALLALVSERVVYRRLSQSSVFARMAASAGVLLALFGVSEYIWLNPLNAGTLKPRSLFPHTIVSVAGVNASGQQIGVITTVLIVVLLIGAFFRFTRRGLELRAVVTNPGLAELRGVNSLRVNQLAWVLSYVLAAVAGLLIAPMTGGDPALLTLIVVYSLAAAVLGGLTSLPLALAGALGLGVMSSLVLGYVPTGSLTSYASGVLPFAFLFFALVFQARRFSAMQGGESKTAILADLGPAAARRRPALAGTVSTAALVAVAGLIIWATSAPYLTLLANAVALALVYLSYRIFTATTGMVSFAQAAFAGIGAFTAATLISSWGWPWPAAVIGGGLVAAVAGALMALPTVRLRGVFLALATLAFAQLVDTGVFSSLSFTGGFSGKRLPRPQAFRGDLAYLLLLLAIFLAVAYMCERFQYSVVGRELKAELGSSSGALSIGIRPEWGRLLAFMLSAGVAGLAGSLLSGIIQLVTVSTWSLVPTAFVWLATVAIAGVGSTAMVLQLGVFAAVFNQVLTEHFPNVLNAWVAIFGVLALLALRVPGGMYAIQASQRRTLSQLLPRRRERGGRPATAEDNGKGQARITPVAREGRRERLPEERSSPNAPDNRIPALAVDGLTVCYKGFTAVSKVDLEVPRGEIRALIGPNGAGKTSLFNAICGYVRPSGGTMQVHGRRTPFNSPHAAWAAGIGRTFQRMELFWTLDVRDHLLLAQRHALRRDRLAPPALDDTIELLGLGPVQRQLVAELPQGTCRLVELARAICTGANLILLDEPCSGLDRRETELLGQALRGIHQELGLSLLIVEHDMEFILSIAKHVLVMNYGEMIAQGTPAEIRASADVRSAYLGSAEVPADL